MTVFFITISALVFITEIEIDASLLLLGPCMLVSVLVDPYQIEIIRTTVRVTNKPQVIWTISTTNKFCYIERKKKQY